MSGPSAEKSLYGRAGRFFDWASSLHLQFFVSHPNFPLVFIRAVYHCRHKRPHLFLAPPSFKIHADPGVDIHPGDNHHGIRGMGCFLEILLPNFWKSAHFNRVPLFLPLRPVCRPAQIHKRGIPKPAPRPPLILRRSIHAGLLCRLFEVMREALICPVGLIRSRSNSRVSRMMLEKRNAKK